MKTRHYFVVGRPNRVGPCWFFCTSSRQKIYMFVVNLWECSFFRPLLIRLKNRPFLLILGQSESCFIIQQTDSSPPSARSLSSGIPNFLMKKCGSTLLEPDVMFPLPESREFSDVCWRLAANQSLERQLFFSTTVFAFDVSLSYILHPSL